MTVVGPIVTKYPVYKNAIGNILFELLIIEFSFI
jgi:hypothetical protein